MQTEHPKARRNQKKGKSFKTSALSKERCTKEYNLTKEPSLNINDRSSEGALAHRESKSSTIKGRVTQGVPSTVIKKPILNAAA